MTIDTAIRWWAAVTVIIVAPVFAGFIENVSVLSPAYDLAGACELPLLTQAVVPKVGYFTESGFALAAAALLALAVSFKLAGSEVIRYRALTIVSLLAWSTVLIASTQAYLALFVFPLAKCGA